MIRSTLAILSVIFIVIASVNFITFVAEAERLGGDALNGYERDGHFYVSSHGHAKEIDEETWRRYRAHAISVFLTHPMGMLAIGYLLLSYAFPAFIFRGTSAARAETEHAVRSSGTPWVTFRCGGKIGRLNVGGPLLRVAVHPRGIRIKPVLMAPFAIPASEIVQITVSDKWLMRGIELQHCSPCVASPILLAVKDPRARRSGAAGGSQCLTSRSRRRRSMIPLIERGESSPTAVVIASETP